ncbi:hypothetical protein BCR33DRAFT_715982 [Rhizoclosmatium globosum]|uniref:Uncharacterized protein n=1 Tax=Rhizoclosmatium globosum TaxID=329046 RepID=A0A1Y2CG11_9FUNG|nr:hypothetical protein BCR33DRAFT_715982 [Rhizoclosmatium globosum]|eukprot:ORY45969.1 hypothetical protein BCR33DRAFT_715982 [Rhizoclosmatium globosum]
MNTNAIQQPIKGFECQSSAKSATTSPSSAERLTHLAVRVLSLLSPTAATSLELRRLVAVFVSCSARASDQRRAQLPTNVLTALLIAHRIAKKAVSSESEAEAAVPILKSNLNVAVPPPVRALIDCPVDLMLTSLMLAETVISDSQTSTASWARLLDASSGPVPSELRQRISKLKWTALEWLDFNLNISRDTFLRVSAPVVPSVTLPIRTNSPITLPPPVMAQNRISASNISILAGYIYPGFTQQPSSYALSNTLPSATHTTCSAQASLNLSFSLKPPHFSLSSCRTASTSSFDYAGAGGRAISINVGVRGDSVRSHPYQKRVVASNQQNVATIAARRLSYQQVV